VAAFEDVARYLATSSSEQAATWLRGLPSSDARNRAIASFAASWSEIDPLVALQWSLALNPAEGRADAMQQALNRWADRDLLAAAEWLSEHEADPATIGMIANLVSGRFTIKPDQPARRIAVGGVDFRTGAADAQRGSRCFSFGLTTITPRRRVILTLVRCCRAARSEPS